VDSDHQQRMLMSNIYIPDNESEAGRINTLRSEMGRKNFESLPGIVGKDLSSLDFRNSDPRIEYGPGSDLAIERGLPRIAAQHKRSQPSGV